MKNKNVLALATMLGAFVTTLPALFAQSNFSTQAHHDAVSAVIPLGVSHTDTDSDAVIDAFDFFSMGKDGFVIKWDGDGTGEHYQMTNSEIRLAAVSPDGNDVAIYETDGAKLHRISVWNWKTLTKKYSRVFSDTITALSYSANGTYLMAGTATVDGVVVMRTSNGSDTKLIKDSTGIISYIMTGTSEKTAVMYSPSGNISYYDLRNGRMKERFLTEQGLTQVCVFNNGLFMAGVRGNTIYIVYALTGQTIASYQCEGPVLLKSEKDSDLYYLDSGGRGTYTLCVIKNRNNRSMIAPEIIKSMTGPRGSQAICTGAKSGQIAVLGTSSGEIYKMKGVVHLDESDKLGNSASLSKALVKELFKVTDASYEKIVDVAAVEDDFYFLTENALFSSSYDTGKITRIADNNGRTRIALYDNGAVLWSYGTRDAVLFLDMETKRTKAIFSPTAAIQSVKVFGDKILIIENYTNIVVYDMMANAATRVYTGTALQDAVIMPDGNVYVAKSSATKPNTPLVSVNIDTEETVAIQTDGNVMFSLCDADQSLYGISMVSNNKSNETRVFAYNTLTKRTETLIKFTDDDLGAFVYYANENLYTNIGSDKIRCYDIKTKKNFLFDRSASMPLKIARNSIRAVVLNYDGSVSWHNTSTPQIVADWYLTHDGKWIEF